MESSGNRLDRSPEAPELIDEIAFQEDLQTDAGRCMFMVADMELLANPETPEADTLIGEVYVYVCVCNYPHTMRTF